MSSVGMKLNAHSCAEDEGVVVVEECVIPAVAVVVGYALTSKKKKSFLQPNLIVLARYCFYISLFRYRFFR